MRVCMKFRGIDLRQIHGSDAVMTDGAHWMREYFLVEGRLLQRYRDYLLQTILPRASPGVHLIVFARTSDMSAATFQRKCDALAIDLQALISKQSNDSPTTPAPLVISRTPESTTL